MSATFDAETSVNAQLSDDRIMHAEDCHRDVLLAVQRGLAARWEYDSPRIAIIEHGGIATVFVSTARTLAPAVRDDIRGAARAAMAPYVSLAPFTRVIFLRRAD